MPLRVLIWSHELAPELVSELAQRDIEVVATAQADSDLVPAYSMHQLYFAWPEWDANRDTKTVKTRAQRWSDAAFRSYARCIARLGFVPFTREYYSYFGGSIALADIEDWAQFHVDLACCVLQRHQVDQVWFFAPLHLGLDNAMAEAARRLGCCVLLCQQTPAPFKFAYAVKHNGAALALPALSFRPWTAGAKQPNLFYMQPTQAKTVRQTLPERAGFVLRKLLQFDLRSLAQRWYLAAANRNQERILALLEWADSGLRPFAAQRRAQRAERTHGNQQKRTVALSAQTSPFVYFALHLEPEASTSAAGGEFANQVDAIAALRELLPDGWDILVKENPKQRFLHRSRLFYQRIAAMDRVFFVPDDTPSAELLAKAQLVSTISGTVGYEALLKARACLHFGTPWYEGLPGACRYSKDLDLQAIVAMRVDQQALAEAVNRYLSAAADGIIAPRFAQLIDEKSSWVSVAAQSAESLAVIAYAAQGVVDAVQLAAQNGQEPSKDPPKTH